MSGERIEEAVGQLRSGSGPSLHGRPIDAPLDSPEVRFAALEGDIRKLYKGLISAQRQIDDLASKISGP